MMLDFYSELRARDTRRFSVRCTHPDDACSVLVPSFARYALTWSPLDCAGRLLGERPPLYLHRCPFQTQTEADYLVSFTGPDLSGARRLLIATSNSLSILFSLSYGCNKCQIRLFSLFFFFRAYHKKYGNQAILMT